MNDGAPETRDRIAAVYLRQLQELAGELCVATDAIAANALPSFQDSVARQEVLCASLASMTRRVSEEFRSSDRVKSSSIDFSLQSRIRVAGRALHELNLRYAALLKHSGKTIALLASLCNSHSGRFQEARGPRLKHQTWSCEM
jgi:hypothetical protein